MLLCSASTRRPPAWVRDSVVVQCTIDSQRASFEGGEEGGGRGPAGKGVQTKRGGKGNLREVNTPCLFPVPRICIGNWHLTIGIGGIRRCRCHCDTSDLGHSLLVPCDAMND